MKAEYNKQGAARKELADAISQITGESAKYLFLPAKAYQIGSIMVGETGTVECEDAALFQQVVQDLAAKGFRPENRVPSWKKGCNRKKLLKRRVSIPSPFPFQMI